METLIMVLAAVVGLMTGFRLGVLLDRRRKRKLAEKIEVAY